MADEEEYEGRCMKCSEKRKMKDVEIITMKNGMEAAKGKCVECGTTVMRILGKAGTHAAKQAEAAKKAA